MTSEAQAMYASPCPQKEPSTEKVSSPKVALSLDALLGGGGGFSPKLLPGVPRQSKLSSNKIKPPPGLEMPSLKDAAGSDVETGTGSEALTEGDSTSTHSGETEAPPSQGLVFSEVSTLTSKAPRFQPMLSPETVNMIMPDSSTSRPRTKLRAKANAYVPAAAFVPLAATAMAMAETLTRSTEATAAQSYAAGYADAAVAAAQMLKAGSSPAAYSGNNDWDESWNDAWKGYMKKGKSTFGDHKGWPKQEW